ncbi:MAG: DHA2 family efflux MFS transporter permease subunit [Candidatus Eremiobacteraeota bacterium]|nr:DHA2 family efflux MFS transporter permease subunit [Candidatus Eremiobacteraeota bacterium]
MATVLTRPPGRAVIPIPQTPPRSVTVPPSYVEFGWRRIVVVAGVMMAALLQTIDATIVNVALPTIQGNLGATVDEATWVVTAYVIANIVVIPMTPWLQTRFGRKNYFLVSIAGFTVASMLCGLATSLPMLVAFRVVQGVFGGGLLPTSQVVLRDTFPPEALGTSQSIFAVGAVLGPSIGPTLGGILTDNLSWQWVFDVNLLPGILACVVLAVFLRGNESKKSSVDVPGIVLLTVAIGALQYVLDQGQHDDWFNNSTICVMAVVSAVAAIGFVWRELVAKSPVVDVRVLAQIPVTAGSLIAVGIGTIIYGGLLILPQYVIGILGFTSTLAGILIGIRALPIALLTITVGKIANHPRTHLPAMIATGLVIASVSCIWLARVITTGSVLTSFVPPLLLMGFGTTFVYTPTLVATLRAVKPSDIPKAAAFITLFAQLGGSVAAASLVAFIERRADFHQAVLAAAATLDRPAVSSFLQQHSLTQLASIVTTQSSTMAFADGFFITGVVGLLTVPLPFLTLMKGARS